MSEHVASVDLWYPRVSRSDRTDERPTIVQVGLMDVRAADDIQISYDFERDGYVIKQASIFEWPNEDDVCDPDWQEVAFVKSWARDTDASESPEATP